MFKPAGMNTAPGESESTDLVSWLSAEMPEHGMAFSEEILEKGGVEQKNIGSEQKKGHTEQKNIGGEKEEAQRKALQRRLAGERGLLSRPG